LKLGDVVKIAVTHCQTKVVKLWPVSMSVLFVLIVSKKFGELVSKF